MSRNALNQHLSMPGLLREVSQHFETIIDPDEDRECSLADCLMSSLAVFLLKFPELLEFDERLSQHPNAPQNYNLRKLFGVKKVPFNTFLRKRLDRVEIIDLRVCFKKIFAQLQRGGVINNFTVFDGYHLLSFNKTKYYSSNDEHCASCCTLHHRGGRVSYYHQMLAAALVHPDHNNVVPFAPEMIVPLDGMSKNDCESNASLRFLEDFRREHPHLKVIVLEDGFASNELHIKNLRSKNLRFILRAKEKDHQFLFELLNNSDDVLSMERIENTPKGKIVHSFRWLNGVPLNETPNSARVNFLEYEEIRPNGTSTCWTWVSDLDLNQATIMEIMRAARSRWRFDPEILRILKILNGHDLEYGNDHGKYSLCTVFAMLSVLGYLIDQIQEHCCPLFMKALAHHGRKSYFWGDLFLYYKTIKFNDWESFWNMIAQSPELATVETSSDWRTP